MRSFPIAVAALLSLATSNAFAWGPDGHHAIGAIADKLIVGSHAADQVNAIFGGLSLQDAAVWADCAKGINPSKGFTYQGAGTYPECKIYETPAEEAAMSDYVRRNDTNCVRKPKDESCHRQYHYADVAIQHDHYQFGWVGTRNDDIAAAVSAATHVLKGDPAPAPFDFKDKREALLLLAHYVGDIHQPLHVGAVYLNANGKRVNPDTGTFDPKTETRGGNNINVLSKAGVKGKNLHATWDAIPTSLNALHMSAARLNQARAVPATSGAVFDWPTSWASDTTKEAQQAFTGLTFGPLKGTHWSVTLPAGYSAKMSAIKKKQLTEAGARLAQLLQEIWP